MVKHARKVQKLIVMVELLPNPTHILYGDCCLSTSPSKKTHYFPSAVNFSFLKIGLWVLNCDSMKVEHVYCILYGAVESHAL
jgi:hypothetical protein